MKIYLTVVLIVLPLGVMAAAVPNGSLSTQNLQEPLSGSPDFNAVYRASLSDPQPILLLAHSAADTPGKSEGGDGEEIDLREVDWDKVKAGQKAEEAKKGNGKGDGNGNGDEEGDEEKEEDNKDEEEAGGGWDRQWDSPRLG